MIIYVLQESDKSRCKYCNRYVHLLIEKEASAQYSPIFFICFDCRRVFQAGIGEVEPGDAEEL
jgi:uncharacterized protein with PIN domain